MNVHETSLFWKHMSNHIYIYQDNSRIQSIQGSCYAVLIVIENVGGFKLKSFLVYHTYVMVWTMGRKMMMILY